MVMRRDVPVWVLPGGGIDEGESPEEAVLREIEEETGLKTQIHRKVAEYTPLNRLTRYTHTFECTPISGNLSITDETKRIAFFPLSKLPKKIPPPYPDWIHDAAQNAPATLHKPITSTSYLTFCYHLLRHPILVFRFLLSRLGLHLNT